MCVFSSWSWKQNCMFVHTSGNQRPTLGSFLGYCPPWFFSRDGPSLTCNSLIRLDVQWAIGTWLPTPHQQYNDNPVPLHKAYLQVLQIRHRSPCLYKKHFTTLCVSPSLIVTSFYRPATWTFLWLIPTIVSGWSQLFKPWCIVFFTP